MHLGSSPVPPGIRGRRDPGWSAGPPIQGPPHCELMSSFQ